MFCITARTSDLVQSKPVNRRPWKVSVITALRKRGLTVDESSNIFFFVFFLRFNWGNGFDDHKCIRWYHLLEKQKLKYNFLPLCYIFFFISSFFFFKNCLLDKLIDEFTVLNKTFGEQLKVANKEYFKNDSLVLMRSLKSSF